MLRRKLLLGFTSFVSLFETGCSNEANFNLLDETKINYYGRVAKKSNSEILFYNSLSGFEMAFVGSELYASFSQGIGQYLRIYLDNSDVGTIQINETTKLCSNLENIEHKIRVLRCNYEVRGIVALNSIYGASKYLKSPPKPELKFEFYGDSITVGHEIYRDENIFSDLSNEDATKAFAALTADHFNAEVSALCCSGASVAIPAYIQDWVIADRFNQYSFTTNSDAWDFSNYVADYIVINLGTNDAANFDESDKDPFVNEYKQFLFELRKNNAKAKIVCCYGMMGTSSLVEGAIQTAINQLNDSKIYYKGLSKVELGVNTFHPTLKGHVDGAKELIKFIESIFNE